MKITRDDHENLTSTVTLEFEPSDYTETYKTELKKYAQKAQLKGFRKGKVPKNYITKMYGRPVLAEVIIAKVNKELTGFIQQEKIDTLGQPLPSSDQAQYEFDPNEPTNYTFKFDLGLAPEFDIKGLEEGNPLEYPEVAIDPADVDEELLTARKRLGKEVEVEEAAENDRVVIKAVELDNGQPKDGGWENTFPILIKVLQNEDFKKQMLEVKTGESFDFDIRDVAEGQDENYIRKYLLGMEEGDETVVGNEFRGTVEKIVRIDPADLDEEFFDKYFGPEVKTEDDARKNIESQIKAFYERQSDALFFRNIQDRLLKQNEFDMPREFLERWMKSTNEEAEESKIEEGMDDFIRSLRWTLIRNKLSKENDIQVAPEELTAYFKEKIRQYFGGYNADDNMLEYSAQRLMQDEEQVNRAYDEILTDKVFMAIKDKVDKKVNVISKDELEKMIEAARQ